MVTAKPSSTDSQGHPASEDSVPSALHLECLKTHFPARREDFPLFLNCQELTGYAAEVGVQRGLHASAFLDKWKGKELYLVDRWEHVPSDTYVDIANVQSSTMGDIKSQALVNLQKHEGRFKVFPMWSSDAAREVGDRTLDFVYLDARHDFNGVVEDLESWWPKLRVGGILAGHDYCDGELPEGDFFVRSAINAFFGCMQGSERSVFEASAQSDGQCCEGRAKKIADWCLDGKLSRAAIHQTTETGRYPSFFILKTERLDSFLEDRRQKQVAAQSSTSDSAAAQNQAAPIPYNFVYPRYSFYFSLFFSHARGRREHFQEQCNLLCQTDCGTRLKRVAKAPGEDADEVSQRGYKEFLKKCVRHSTPREVARHREVLFPKQWLYTLLPGQERPKKKRKEGEVAVLQMGMREIRGPGETDRQGLTSIEQLQPEDGEDGAERMRRSLGGHLIPKSALQSFAVGDVDSEAVGVSPVPPISLKPEEISSARIVTDSWREGCAKALAQYTPELEGGHDPLGYASECRRRCSVTCRQRETLFQKILVTNVGLRNPLAQESFQVIRNQRLCAGCSRDCMVCPNRKHSFLWDIPVGSGE